MNFAEQLRTQHARLSRLLELLTRERALLAAGKVDGVVLGQLASDKQQVLADVADLELRRKVTRTQLGYSSDWAGDDLVAQANGCLDLWRRVRAGARNAAQLNHFNGQLIALRMASNQHMLNDLRSLAGDSLYGPDGQARGSASRVTSQA